MTATARSLAPVLRAERVNLVTPTGRVLVHGLDVTLEREHVAIVGRNGVGKSTLLRVLAGADEPTVGKVTCRGRSGYVPQQLDEEAAASRGEQRRALLEREAARDVDLLLLDEPTEDLDLDAVDWLCGWLRTFPGALLVVSHHRQLLSQFEHFFVLEESGCRYFSGTFDALLVDMQERDERARRRYASRLSELEARERHDVVVRRRRRRKKNLGRLHEERRGVSRARLGEKKRYAQVSQAKAAKVRQARRDGERAWAKAARRALSVELPLELVLPTLPDDDGRARIVCHGVAVDVPGRRIVDQLDLRIGRERIAVLGPNGAGKTTLLEVITQTRRPSEGMVSVTAPLGYVAQGATNWEIRDSLVEQLLGDDPGLDPERAAEIVAAHGFPLGLALRPLASLSAGERTRAALIALYQRAPEILVLDEPSYSLDFVGASALAASLARWPGTLVVTSHDRGLLVDIGIERQLDLGKRGTLVSSCR